MVNKLKSSKHRPKTSIDNLRNGLLRLRGGFAVMDAREEKEELEQFERGFRNLISQIHQARQQGLWSKADFNLFRLLGYQRLEEAHSNLLAWLLDPEESHGLGDQFLRAFFKKVFDKEPSSYSAVKVTREGQEGEDRPDIVVEGKNWWLVIENKVYSAERPGQTVKYARRWGMKGKIRENVFLVFLTPSGTDPESNDFVPVPYLVVQELLENASFQHDVHLFVKHFIEHIFLDLEG